MIVVTFALAAESRDFRKRRSRHDLEVFHTGVGKRVCERRLRHYLAGKSVEYLVSAGFAGAVSGDLQVGDILLSNNFSDPELLAMARTRLPRRFSEGRLHTADAVADSTSDRERIAAQTEAVAVDMETQSIHEICPQYQVPLLSLRVISDTPARPFPCPPEVLFDLQRQKTRPGVLMRHLLMHPAAISRLVAFSRQIAQARANLADALAAVLA